MSNNTNMEKYKTAKQLGLYHTVYKIHNSKIHEYEVTQLTDNGDNHIHVQVLGGRHKVHGSKSISDDNSLFIDRRCAVTACKNDILGRIVAHQEEIKARLDKIKDYSDLLAILTVEPQNTDLNEN